MNKKLYFLLPLVSWIGCYFLWQIPLSVDNVGVALWWGITGFMGIVVTIFSLVFALGENDLI